MARIDLFLSLIERNRHWLLFAQLGVLHLVLVQDIASPIARTLLVAHIGLFLLWQPLVRAHTPVGWGGLALTAVMVAAAAFGASVWLLIGWVMLLAAIIGGKVFFSDSQVPACFICWPWVIWFVPFSSSSRPESSRVPLRFQRRLASSRTLACR